MSYRKHPWKFRIQWRDQQPENFSDIISGHFKETMNKPGGFAFTVPTTERALDVLWGSKLYLEYRGRTQFGGVITGSDIDEGKDIITFQGIDWLGWLNRRLIDFQSANYTSSPYDRQTVESSEIVEELIKRYTGTSGTDSDFDFVNLDHTATDVDWNLLGRKLGESLITIASSSATADGRIGHFISILGDRTEIRMKPYGWKYYPQGLPLTNLRWSFDISNLRNRVFLRGGLPVSYPVPDFGAYGANTIADLFENNITTNWAATMSGSGSTSIANTNYSTIGYNAGDWDCVNSLVATANFYLTWDGSDWNENWSNPSHSGPFTGSSGTNAYNTSVFIISHAVLWVNSRDTTATGGWRKLKLRLYTTGTSNYCDVKRKDTTDDYWFRLGVNDALDDNWRYFIWDFNDCDLVYTSGFDWANIDGCRLELEDGLSMDSHIHVDGLAFMFKESNAWAEDTSSPWEPTEERYEFRNIADWEKADTTANQLLTQLKYPSVLAKGNMPWYDPRLEVGDLLYQDIKGKSIPLYVTSLDTKFAADLVNVSVNLGRPRPSPKDVETAFGVILSGKSEAGTGYQLAAPFTSSKCYRLCERQCELDCLTTACQTNNQIGMNTDDLCLTTCQTFRQRNWYGDQMTS